LMETKIERILAWAPDAASVFFCASVPAYCFAIELPNRKYICMSVPKTWLSSPPTSALLRPPPCGSIHTPCAHSW
jgi:hypothetical protein